MKKIFLFFVIALISTQIFSQDDRRIIDKVIANVGNEYVLLSDLEEMFSRVSAEQGGLPPEARCSFLENQLATNLLLNQARLDSIVVGDTEVEAQLDARIEQILGWMNGDIKQFEDYYGQTVPEVKSRFREDLKNQILVERMQGSIMADATVTPSEVKAFFDRIPKDSLPYFSSEVELGEIVFKTVISDEQKKKAKNKLEGIRKQVIEGGADFAELAKTHSADPGSGRAGGDLGWSKRGNFVPEFEATAYNLEEGGYSEVIETEFGYHFLNLLGRRGNSVHVRHILIKPDVTEKDKLATLATLDSIRHLVAIDTLPFSFAVKLYSDKKQQSYNNDGRMINPKTGNTFFETADLEPDVFLTMDTMKIGQISDPIEFDMRGEPAYRMIYLQSKTDPHKANLKQDYDKIRTAAIEERKAVFMSDWIEGKINSTYIHVDKAYQGCTNLNSWVPDWKTIKP